MSAPSPRPDNAAATVRQLRQVMAVSTGLLVAATWPLWLPATPLPQIPWTAWAARLPRGAGEIATVANLAVLLLLQFVEIRRPWLRRGLNACFFLTSVPMLLVLDQHRLQPWVWQMLLWGGVIVLSRSSRTSLACLRWLTISLYFWSAVSKIDRAFLEGHGQVLLGGLADSVGLSSELWSESLRHALAAAMPVGELALALLLIARRTHRLGLWMAVAMHVALILALGPTGLGHEWGVLIWNAFFIVNAWLLFRPGESQTSAGEPEASAGEPQTPVWGSLTSERSTHPQTDICGSPSAWGAPVVTWLACLLPALSLVGWWDWWPSWAVYSAQPAVVRMLVHESDVERLPPSLQPHVGAAAPLSEWRPVNLDGWSFATCWCPMYPQERYRLAVIAALAHQAQLEPRVEIRSTPDRWSGRRAQQTLSADELTQRLDSFWCNTSPRRR